MSLVALLTDYTIQNVVIGATFLGLISGVLGSFAVLRQQSLLGDTLSHAALSLRSVGTFGSVGRARGIENIWFFGVKGRCGRQNL